MSVFYFQNYTMAKRFTDTDVWKRQSWFKKLSVEYKLVFFYIKDMCDQIGVWKIDCVELSEDLGLESFNLDDFIKKCNRDFDKLNGKEKKKERVKLISKTELWLTGFVQFQYEAKESRTVSNNHVIGGSALAKLKAKGLYQEAVKNGYIRVNQ